MARLCGVQIPNEKRIVIALTYIYGIGKPASQRILKELNINENVKTKDLTEGDLAKLRDALAKEQTEGDRRRKVQMDVKRLQEIGSYRGYRHRRRLPVRGQRTKTNARTKRGRKVAVAGKKTETK
ncbi:30S ribosomal protein S13 [Candidatus Peregrinibacteria bacterium]|jgi:small subunit ribosomal protein S13|nr:30S ribosomal protein S13 [Candidatus Peregrinibacteria bacterium]MBT4631647.1 30S ribosomal protein S13 [Candidatus Peregrinibacteria bacterium]MBT5516775.1 30S ribosomal protein S13 [Candidatus Peregrinibacteria bacterium]MBT5823943.1 30S ribosomal protein S13 [Candidatus Peregrinibacteria bacterium]